MCSPILIIAKKNRVEVWNVDVKQLLDSCTVEKENDYLNYCIRRAGNKILVASIDMNDDEIFDIYKNVDRYSLNSRYKLCTGRRPINVMKFNNVLYKLGRHYLIVDNTMFFAFTGPHYLPFTTSNHICIGDDQILFVLDDLIYLCTICNERKYDLKSFPNPFIGATCSLALNDSLNTPTDFKSEEKVRTSDWNENYCRIGMSSGNVWLLDKRTMNAVNITNQVEKEKLYIFNSEIEVDGTDNYVLVPPTLEDVQTTRQEIYIVLRMYLPVQIIPIICDYYYILSNDLSVM